MSGLVVHEWVAKTGGSENVVEQFLKTFPDADLQVLWNDDPARFPVTTYETWLARTPLRHSKALSLPLLPATWRTIRAHKPYDWVLTSSHLFAHHARPRGLASDVPKYSYVHTPARYIWEPDLDHRGDAPIVRAAAALLKPLDKKRARESTKMAANSEFTRARIQRAWDRDADVIYPPVDTERIIAGGDWRHQLTPAELTTLEQLPEGFLLGASRFVPYKRLGLAIEAGEATRLPVVIAGKGPQEEQLRAQAAESSTSVSFVISPSDAMLFALYQRATALVFPAVEDFGIMPVEAMAAGTPVIVPVAGGAAESAALLQGGSSVAAFTPAAWRSALDEAEGIDRVGLPQRTLRFSQQRFRSAIDSWVQPSVGLRSPNGGRG